MTHIPTAGARLSGNDIGGSTNRRRAREAAARVCRETGEVVLYDAPGEVWELTKVAGRAMWTKLEDVA